MTNDSRSKSVKSGAKVIFTIASIFLIIGLGIGVPQIVNAIDDRRIVSEGDRAVGVITEVDFSSYRGRDTVIKTVEFTVDGTTYKATGKERINLWKNGPKEVFIEKFMNKDLVVYYDTQDPVRNVVKDHEASLASPILSTTLLGGAGLILVLGGHHLSNYNHDQKLKSEDSKVVGIVTDVQYEMRTSRKNRSEKIPKVSYTVNNKEYMVESSLRYNPRREGSQAEVRENLLHNEKIVFYDSSNPSDSVVEGWEYPLQKAYVDGGFFIVLGTVFASVSLYLLRRKSFR